MIRDALDELVDVLDDEPDPYPHLRRALLVALAEDDIAPGDAAAATAAGYLVCVNAALMPGAPSSVHAWCERRADRHWDDLLPQVGDVFDRLLTAGSGWAVVRADVEAATTLDQVRGARDRLA